MCKMMYNVHYIVYLVQFACYIVHCTLYSVQCTVITHCTVYDVLNAFYVRTLVLASDLQVNRCTFIHMDNGLFLIGK